MKFKYIIKLKKIWYFKFFKQVIDNIFIDMIEFKNLE